MFYKELNGDKFKYKGIDCSENIIKEQIYDLRTSNGMFVYKIDYDELNKCYFMEHKFTRTWNEEIEMNGWIRPEIPPLETLQR